MAVDVENLALSDFVNHKSFESIEENDDYYTITFRAEQTEHPDRYFDSLRNCIVQAEFCEILFKK